jgi:hypothetical protein
MPHRPALRAHRGRRVAAALAFSAASFATTAASASDPCAASPLVSTCVNSDNLWPHAGAQVFATVGGVDTVEPGHFGFGLVSDYQSRPIVFHVPGPGGGGTDAYAIDNQVNGNFLWALGVTRRLELDFALPITFAQSGGGAAPVTGSSVPLHDTAMRDIRFGFAYQLLAHDAAHPTEGFGVTGRFEMSAPNGDRDEFAGDATGVFVPSLAADFRSGRWLAGLELGARIRPDAQVQGANVGPQGTIALGVGYDLLNRSKLLGVMVEARALPTFSTQYTLTTSDIGTTEAPSGGALVPAEWMLSLRSSPLPTDDLSVTVGGGSELSSGAAGVTAPRFRFLFSVRFAPTDAPRKSAHGASRPPPRLDLNAAADVCKDDPDTVDGFKDTDGCPDEDADKDGIDDRYDRCPLVPEDFAGLTDGCPDVPGKTAPSSPSEKP